MDEVSLSQAPNKTSVFFFLSVALAVAAILWYYHGVAVALGFIFIETQLLIMFSLMGTATAALQKMTEFLRLLSGASVDFRSQQQPADGLKKNPA